MKWPSQAELAEQEGYSIMLPSPNSPVRIPDNIYHALEAYAIEHKPVGGFLQSCLENNFLLAVLRADAISFHALKAIAMLIANSIPSNAHGSQEAYAEWIANVPCAKPEES